jgi:oxamate amidohydrolase
MTESWRRLSRLGSPLTAADLAATRTREAAPLSLVYRGYELLAPPPTQGVSTLAIMGVLEHFDLRAHGAGSADHIHLCVEAVKRAFLTRDAIADPDFAAQPVEEWLNPDRLAATARTIAVGRALAWPQPFRTGDTVFFGAVDGQGRSASVLQSLYFDWGSSVQVGETGILWQNRGAAFSVVPGHPNALAPGKRPFYTLNPGLGLKDGKPAFVYGTQGADGQPQTLSMVLTRLIDFGEAPAAALAGPRFLLGKTFSDNRDSLKIESDVGAATLANLAARSRALADRAAEPARRPRWGDLDRRRRRRGGSARSPRRRRRRGGVTICATGAPQLHVAIHPTPCARIRRWRSLFLSGSG